MAAVLAASAAHAQIATDGTAGARIALDGDRVLIGADLGSLRGENLFHSFRRFSVNEGGSVVFGLPGGATRVISRVTGPSATAIDGRVTLADETFSRFATADFWFINPNGVSIGPTATFRIGGGLFISGGDSLVFEGGEALSANLADGLTLTSAAPEAFGFLTQPGPVTITGFQFRDRNADILIAGGDVRFEDAAFTSLTSDITLHAAAAGDLARVAPDRGARAGGGSITIVGNADPTAPTGTLETSAGGAIRLIGGDISIDGGRAVTGALTGPGGDIEVSGASLTIENGGSLGTLSASEFQAGSIAVQADQALLIRGGAIRSQALAGGDAGAIRITGFNTLTVDRGGEDAETAIESEVSVAAAGNAGVVTVRGGAVKLIDGGSIFSSTFGDGDAGAVTVRARTIEGDGGSQIASGARDNPDVAIRASGGGGAVTVIATESISFSGRLRARSGVADAAERESSGLLASTEGRFTGDGGALFASAPLIRLSDEAEIGAETFFDADAGNLRLEGAALIVETGAEISTTSRRSGAAGNVTLSFSDTIDLPRRGSIASRARRDQGTAGAIDITTGALTIGQGSRLTTDSNATDGGAIRVFTTDFALIDDGLATTSVASSAGDGGSINFAGGALVLSDAALLESTARQGAGGDVTIASVISFIETPEAEIDVSSALGRDGTVTILGVVGDQTAEAEAPPAEFFNRFALIDDFCVAAVTGGSALRLTPRAASPGAAGAAPTLFGGAIPYPGPGGAAAEAATLSLALNADGCEPKG